MNRSFLAFATLPLAVIFAVSNCYGQEKIRIDEDTVHVTDSPWTDSRADTDANLNSISAVDGNHVWVCGTHGTVLRSTDGGSQWKVRTMDKVGGKVPDLADIHAFDDATAIVISSDSPAKIFRTTNGGLRWKAVLKYPDAAVTFRTLTFWDTNRGVVTGSSVDGKILLLRTTDAGMTWKRVASESRPGLEYGEQCPSIGGTAVQVRGNDGLVIALGGDANAKPGNSCRMLMTNDFLRSWTVGSVPVKRTANGGIFSVHFIDGKNGVAVGGQPEHPDFSRRIYSVTKDNGKTWGTPSPAVPPSGLRTSVDHYIDGKEIVLVAVGPNGTDLSTDLGNRWRKVSDKGFNTVHFDQQGDGWAAGDEGKVAKWTPEVIRKQRVKKQPARRR